MNSKTATLCGLLAIILWSSLIGLIRSVTENFGAAFGAALIYTIGAILLLAFVGLPRLGNASFRYLIASALMFAAYEICLALSIGFAHNGTQAIEVSMLNYLWPCLTLLLAIPLNKQRVNLLIIPGSLLALFGIAWILSREGFSAESMYLNMRVNPLSYGLAFVGALIWAFYCNLTKRFAGSSNGITLFFALTAIALWLLFLLSGKPLPTPHHNGYFELVAAAAAMASGYALWNIGLQRGNMTLIATASYFTPVLSSAFAAFWLGNNLNVQFWQGAAIVCIGSLLCWQSTRRR
jgi:drug/metabolite transporter (DMT)-like permease